MKLKVICPVCHNEVKHIQAEFPAFGKIHYVYNCGHIELRDKIQWEKENEVEKALQVKIDLTKQDIEEYTRLTWESPLYEKAPYEEKEYIPQLYWSLEIVPEYHCDECKEKHNRLHLYKYQRDGVDFAATTDFRFLLADEMGLGKTPQAAVIVKSAPKYLTPTLFIVKGATLYQFATEMRRWAFDKMNGVMPILSRNHILPGFQTYVISMDLLAERKSKLGKLNGTKQKKSVLDLLSTLGIKCVVIDEVQSFKDASSSRTIALIEFLQRNEIKYVMELSGTPIKNRADEFFVPLNIVAPEFFNSKAYFTDSWLSCDDKGRYTHIKPWREAEFREVTKRWILRRTVNEVQKDLPELRVNFQLIEIDDENLKKSYNFQLDLFNNWLHNEAKVDAAGLLGWLAKLRAITGQAKCKPAVDFVNDFIESNDSDLIAVGIHHQSVRDTLKYVFNAKGYDPLSLSGEDSKEAKWKTAQAFNKGESRILIINMIAGGVGLNLQGCNNFLAIERSWNGADEDQFHKRFHRHGQMKKVWGTYMIAKGTIDEWFHDLIFSKRINVASANMGVRPDESLSSKTLREFAEIVISNKL